MKREWKRLLGFFAALVGAYFAAFYGCERWRAQAGPWQLAFRTDAGGVPQLEVTHPATLRQARITFHEERVTNSPGPVLVRLTRADQRIPFGTLLYADLTVLPGVATFDFFGHVVEILPRRLIVNQLAIPWKDGLSFDLYRTNRPAQSLPSPEKWRRK